MCQGIRESRNHGPSPQTIVMMIVFYQIQATCKSQRFSRSMNCTPGSGFMQIFHSGSIKYSSPLSSPQTFTQLLLVWVPTSSFSRFKSLIQLLWFRNSELKYLVQMLQVQTYLGSYLSLIQLLWFRNSELKYFIQMLQVWLYLSSCLSLKELLSLDIRYFKL